MHKIKQILKNTDILWTYDSRRKQTVVVFQLYVKVIVWFHCNFIRIKLKYYCSCFYICFSNQVEGSQDISDFWYLFCPWLFFATGLMLDFKLECCDTSKVVHIKLLHCRGKNSAAFQVVTMLYTFRLIGQPVKTGVEYCCWSTLANGANFGLFTGRIQCIF